MGFVAFFGSFLIISIIFGNADDITVSDDGTVHLGLSQTYVESLAGLSSAFFIFLMAFSSLIIGVIYWMMSGFNAAIKKAFEAVGDPRARVELPEYIALNSSLFIGCLFIWINFLLEAVRRRPKKNVKTLPEL